MENPIKMDDLGVPLFQEASIYIEFGRIDIFDMGIWLIDTLVAYQQSWNSG